MAKLSAESRQHLEEALQNEDPSEKDFHIRQVLQVCGMDNIPEELN